LRSLPAYLFEDLVETRLRTEQQGVDVIDLSIGNPDLGAPAVAVEALREHAGNAGLHCYTPPWVVGRFSQAVAAWMKARHGVDLDPGCEILPVIGTKEGLAHLPLAVMDPGETAVVPDPGYPVYSRSVFFAGGRVEWVPLTEENGFLPDIGAIEGLPARLVFVNYPNNPTSATADRGFFEDLVAWAQGSGAYLINDAAYAEVAFDGYRSTSILAAPGAKEVAVEFHSLSKTFSMAGWRVGFVAGNAGVVGALRSLKSNLDSGVFGPILMASIAALNDGWSSAGASLEEYGLRRRLVLECLSDCKVECFKSPATLYIWAKVPEGLAAEGLGSMGFARLLLEKAGVLVAPGVGFGKNGEGYVRISITCPTPRIEAAAMRLREACRTWLK
jgi:LL-diaminopimelate aminotransferase